MLTANSNSNVRWMTTGQTARITNFEQAPRRHRLVPRWKNALLLGSRSGQRSAYRRSAATPSGAKWADPPTVYDRLVYRFNGTGYLKPGYMQVLSSTQKVAHPGKSRTATFPTAGMNSDRRAPLGPPMAVLARFVNRHPESDHEYLDDEVYEFNVSDGSLRPLTNRQGRIMHPPFLPNGKFIAYTGFDDRYQGHQTQSST